jgi:hypothetical protein
VARREAVLRDTVRDAELPASTRQAASWWLNQPTLVQRSAQE